MPSSVPAPTVPPRPTLLPHEDGAHPAATSAPAATPAPVVETTGLLQIVARPWAEVSVDGSQVGTTPFRPLKVAAGPHTVIFTHPDYKPFRRQVTVRPGETARLEVNLTWEAFRK
jgi:serine/threonine-protein kinase